MTEKNEAGAGFNPYRFFLEEELFNSYKKDFEELNYSLVFNIEDNFRMNVVITDSTEKRAHAGISTLQLEAVMDFLNRKLEQIKKIPA